MSLRKGSMTTMLLSFIAVATVLAGNDPMKKTTETATGKFEKATLAGGCFWCMEARSTSCPGGLGHVRVYRRNMKNPTYKQVSAGGTGHARRSRSSMTRPESATPNCSMSSGTTRTRPVNDRQFCDVGAQYRPGIFYHSEEQRLLALIVEGGAGEVQTLQGADRHRGYQGGRVLSGEEYHQHYYKKNPIRYRIIATGAVVTSGSRNCGEMRPKLSEGLSEGAAMISQ